MPVTNYYLNLLRDRATPATPLIAAGLAIVANDTGRVLLLQRALSDDDPASGKWEFPGGHIDPGEEALTAAMREWCEETGCKFPKSAIPAGDWLSPNQVYQGFVYQVPKESDIEINMDPDNRHVLNPDDPDADQIEVVAWWNIEDLPGNPSLRKETAQTDWNAIRRAITAGVEVNYENTETTFDSDNFVQEFEGNTAGNANTARHTNPAIKHNEGPSVFSGIPESICLDSTTYRVHLTERVETTLTNYHEFYNKCHDEKTGHFCEENRGGVKRKVKIEQATPAEKKAARKKALAKIRIAPVPSKDDVLKAREELRRAAEEGKRAGGESRGGGSPARRTQMFNLFKEFGGLQRGYIVDHQSGIKMHYTSDKTLNPNQYPIFERGKIFTKEQGGGYQLPNIIPESFPTNRSRGNRTVREENKT